MPGDAEVLPEVGCIPSGQRTSPWSDGRTQDGADRAEAAFVFGHFCTYPNWKSPPPRTAVLLTDTVRSCIHGWQN